MDSKLLLEIFQFEFCCKPEKDKESNREMEELVSKGAYDSAIGSNLSLGSSI